VVVDEHDADAGHGSRSLAATQPRSWAATATEPPERRSPAARRPAAKGRRAATPTLRPYADRDWETVLDLCLRAFAPGYESLERSLGIDLDWQACIRRHLCSLTRPGERQRLIVAEAEGAVVGVVHYHVDPVEQSGSIGVSAVHPAHQGRGVASRMYAHVLDVMRGQGVKYATAETEGDSANDPVRRAYEKAGFLALPVVRYFVDLARVPPAPVRSRRGDGVDSVPPSGGPRME
jgi:ribosomal protein S18 acetylase RimI-like enzyme